MREESGSSAGICTWCQYVCLKIYGSVHLGSVQYNILELACATTHRHAGSLECVPPWEKGGMFKSIPLYCKIKQQFVQPAATDGLHHTEQMEGVDSGGLVALAYLAAESSAWCR